MIEINDVRKADKEKYKKNGIVGILTRKYLSCYITKFLINNTKITPNQVSVFGFLLVLISVGLLVIANIWTIVLAGILIFLSKVFDSVDGQIARVKKIANAKGALLDNIFDRFREALVIFGISFALMKQTGSLVVWFYGFIALVSVFMLYVLLSSSEKMGKGSLKEVHNEMFLTRLVKKVGVSTQFLAIQSDTYLFITALLVVFNQLMIALWFFIIIINIYWIMIFLVVFFKRQE